MALEHILVLEGELPGFMRVGVFGIIRNAKGNLASWKIGKIILNWLVNEPSSFNSTAEPAEWDVASGY